MKELLHDLNYFYACLGEINPYCKDKTVTAEDLEDIILVDEILYDLDDYCECFEEGFTNELHNRLMEVVA